MNDSRASHRRIRRFAWLAVAAVFQLAQLAAFGAPENTMIVVNADSWASTYIANEYVHARGIPQGNVVYLSDLPSFDRMPVDDFRRKILLPVLKTLADRGLAAQTDAILYSADFPTVIDVAGDAGSQKLPSMLSPHASINSLTYLYPFVLAKSIGYLDLGSNFYARRLALPAEPAPWTDEDRQSYFRAMAEVQEAGRFFASQRKGPAKNPKEDAADGEPESAAAPIDPEEVKKKLAGAVEAMIALKEKHPHSAEMLYNLGCGLALLGRPDEAVAALQASADAGWWDVLHAERDDDLASLHSRDDFKKFIARAKEMKFELTPTMGFRGAVGWEPAGVAVPADKGRRYMISTVLACTSGRGNSVREALAGLKRSVLADGTRPRGTIYFLKNNDVRSRTREWGFYRAVEKLKSVGVKAEVPSGVLPQGRPDVAGLSAGSASFNWSKSGSTILPGAICEHLTSCGGMLHEGDGQTPLTEFIRYGAAGASGAVAEPYSLQAKFPTPFIQYFYAQGCTLGEAFYQAVSGPYQLLIVGDALCKPWARRLAVTADGLSAGATLKGLVKITPGATSPDGIESGVFELYVDGKRGTAARPGESFGLDTAKIPDGLHEFAVIANGRDPIATQGRLVVPVEISNHQRTMTVTPPERREFAWDERIEIKAGLPGAKEIVFVQNGRPVARIAGAGGVVAIDPRVLGQGPVHLTPVGVIESSEPDQVLGQPLDFTVVPPKSLAPFKVPDGHELANDFHVLLHGKTAVTVKQAKGDWLDRAFVGEDTEFTVEGWFSVPVTDVYQFQLRGNVTIESLTVDGTSQNWPRGKEWWFVPVHLAKGLHRVRIEAHGVDHPTLEVRFGGTGTQRMDGARFKHLDPPPAIPPAGKPQTVAR